MVDRRLALDLDLFSRGGMRVLEKIEQQGYDVLARGPPFPRWSASACCWARWRAWPSRLAGGGRMVTVDQSYEYCLRVARSRAKNFYYSFVLLSAQQRKAMCAIYAFMRYCDDLSDEPGATRAAVEQWRADMEEALEGRFSDHPGVARVSPHGAPLRHPARLFPPDDRRHFFRPGAAHASRPSTSSTATATRWRRWWG
jgi:hypothetical protein